MRITLVLTTLLVAGVIAAQDPEVKQPRPPMVTPDVKEPASTTAPKVKVAEAQGPVHPASAFPAPRPENQHEGAAQAIAAAFADPDLVLIDHPGDGRTWVRGHSYKASFGAEGTTFAPLFQNAPKHYPLQFGMPQVTVAGRALRSSGTAMADAEHTVTFDRGDFQERYQLMGKGIEQQFVFERLPVRGAMVVSVPFTTELTAQQSGTGLEFVNQLGKVGYSQAAAVDAEGNRLVLATELRGGSIEITVPAAFVENARLPLVIDPLVGNTVFMGPAGAPPTQVERPDISYDATNDEYAVVVEWYFNPTDTDVYVQRMTGAFAPVGSLVTIESSLAVWTQPKIASNNIAANHLVVSTASTTGASPFWIVGRTVAAGTGATGPQFVIEKAGVAGHSAGDKFNPDVGGDPSPTPPTYYTVVWERNNGPTDHDIHMKQVLPNGTLRGASPILLENSINHDTRPTISKSDGSAPSSSRYWGVSFQRFYSNSDEDIRGALVSWDGVVVQYGPDTTFSVDASTNLELFPTVSSPTDVIGGQRYLLFAYESHVNGGGPGDIVGTVFDVTGTPRSNRTNLTTLEGATPAQQALPQGHPSADSDGCRFIVAFTDDYNAAGTDQDVLISLFSYQVGVPGALVLNEGRQPAGYSGTRENTAEVTSVHSGGGGTTRYAAVWMDDDGPGNDRIEGIRYDGYRSLSTIGQRATGCGGLGITATGNRLGQTMVLSLTGATGFAGFVFGSAQPGLPLPPCPACLVGVANGATLTGNPHNIFLPCQLGALVGAVVAVQGFDFSTGPCLGAIMLSDTLDIGIQ